MASLLRSVLIAVPTRHAYGQQIVEGIADYVQEHGGWRCLWPEGTQPLEVWLRQHRWADGALVQLPPAEARRAIGRRLKTVLVQEGDTTLPQVAPDDRAIAAMAFEHLRQLGLDRFAYAGIPGVPFSDRRCRGFLAAAAAAGAQARVSVFDGNVTWEAEDPHDRAPRLRRWLGQLQRPAGLFLANSRFSRRVFDAADDAGRRIPDDLAIIAVDNDETLCRLTLPPLTAIDQSTHRIGYTAARLLDELMHGKPPPRGPILIPPARVVSRQSTDLIWASNPLVARAIRLVRERACEGLTVAEVLRQVPLSRRSIEIGFRTTLGRTVHDEMIRVRIQQACQLLEQTELGLPEISVRCGFAYPSTLCHVFKRHTGRTPRAYRHWIRSSDRTPE